MERKAGAGGRGGWDGVKYQQMQLEKKTRWKLEEKKRGNVVQAGRERKGWAVEKAEIRNMGKRGRGNSGIENYETRNRNTGQGKMGGAGRCTGQLWLLQKFCLSKQRAETWKLTLWAVSQREGRWVPQWVVVTVVR